MESFSKPESLSSNELAGKTSESGGKIDFSRPLDYSKPAGKAPESGGKIDFSRPLDYSKPAETRLNDTSDRLDTSRPIDFSNHRAESKDLVPIMGKDGKPHLEPTGTSGNSEKRIPYPTDRPDLKDSKLPDTNGNPLGSGPHIYTADKDGAKTEQGVFSRIGQDNRPTFVPRIDSMHSDVNEGNPEATNKREQGETTKTDGKNGDSDEGTERISCRNEHLKGGKHPETGVPFEEKTVETADGKEVTGVFPVFDSVFDAHLPDDLLQASDKEQFDECNKQLKEAVENDPELAAKFTPEQLEQIKNGETPDGYTWHHNEETGKMELVDSETHAKTGHTGGKVIWGGGSENR